MSEKKMKDADEKSDDDGERLATATRETRFSSRAFRRTVVYRDDRRKTYLDMMMCSNSFKHVFTTRYTSFTLIIK